MTNAFSAIASTSLAFLLVVGTAGAQTPQAKAGSTRLTTAVTATPTTVPADYVVGAEDVLGVVFWRETEMSGDVAVRPDGMITLPLVGEIKAAGMKPDALREAIQTAAAKFLSDPNVSVVVRQMNSRKVFITGEVNTPGAFPLAGPRTVMHIIALAGGLKEYAKSDEISVMREENGKTRYFKFNYKEVAKGKKLDQNIQLRPNDTIVVP